jgi:hypothetical protein
MAASRWSGRLSVIVIFLENTIIGEFPRIVGRPIALGFLGHIFAPFVTPYLSPRLDEQSPNASR